MISVLKIKITIKIFQEYIELIDNQFLDFR